MNKSFVVSLGFAIVSGMGAMGLMGSYLVEDEPKIVQVKEEAFSTTLVVAAKPLQMGQKITVGDLKLIKWSSEEVPEGSFKRAEEVLPDKKTIRRYACDVADTLADKYDDESLRESGIVRDFARFLQIVTCIEAKARTREMCEGVVDNDKK